MFKHLKLGGWRQFESVEIDFHPSLTILTGANGAGKTTLLNILNRHFGWNLQFVSTQGRTRRGLTKFFSGRWRDLEDEAGTGQKEIGTITYSDGEGGNLLVPGDVQAVFQVSIENQQTIAGIFVPSHRPIYGVYQKIDSIPTALDARQQLFDRYVGELQNIFQSRGRATQASLQIKQALVSLATFGYGNQAVRPNQDAIETFEGFQRVLKIVLPPSLGFERLAIELPEINLVTRTEEFSFDAVSGGVSALIDISWQIFMRSRIDETFAVVIDEPENHLHPELQKRLLPSLLEAFPQAQFIVATHNPFMVTAVPDSNVYVLKYNEVGKVISELLDWANKAGTSNEVLREVLGLANTLPLWVERRLEEIVGRYEAEPLDEDALGRLRAEMAEAGLGDLFPEAIGKVLRMKDD